MNDYDINQASSTTVGGALIIGALLVFQLGVGPISQDNISLPNEPLIQVEEASRTFGQYTNVLTGNYEDSNLGFEESMASFYAQFLIKQEPLGKEFEQVLYDNLETLLVRT